MAKKLTTYQRPPLERILRSCITVEQLDDFFVRIKENAKEASPKTRRRWEEAYDTQLELIRKGTFKALVELREQQAKQKAEAEAAKPAEPNDQVR